MSRFFLILFLLCCTDATRAQTQLLVYAGGGMSFADKRDQKRTPDRLTDPLTVSPMAGIGLRTKIQKGINLETGLFYNRKSYHLTKNYERWDINNVQRDLVQHTDRLDYINLPLLLSFDIMSSSGQGLSMELGMNYGFLFRAMRDVYIIQSSTQSAAAEYLSRDNPIRKGLVQTSATRHGDLNIFDAAIKVQLTYWYKERIFARLSFDRSFHDIYLRNPKGEPTIGFSYAGCNIGYVLFGKNNKTVQKKMLSAE
jgi:hypothetical protein